jgi:hypothetical protein
VIRNSSLILTITVLCTFDAAASDGYSQHPARVAFDKGPCSEIMGVIDAPAKTKTMEGVALSGLYFGFLVGFDAAKGGMGTSAETTLQRFRESCGKTPNETGTNILNSLQ